MRRRRSGVRRRYDRRWLSRWCDRVNYRWHDWRCDWWYNWRRDRAGFLVMPRMIFRIMGFIMPADLAILVFAPRMAHPMVFGIAHGLTMIIVTIVKIAFILM